MSIIILALLFASFLLTIELLLGYQLICHLFYNDQDIYIRTINYQPIKNEFFVLILASIGMVLSLLFTFVIYYKFSSTPAYNESGQEPSNNYMVYIAFTVLILASLGINIWLIMIYNQINAGEKNIIKIKDKDNETYDLLQKLIPSSIGVFLIQFMIILYYIISINHNQI